MVLDAVEDAVLAVVRLAGDEGRNRFPFLLVLGVVLLLDRSRETVSDSGRGALLIEQLGGDDVAEGDVDSLLEHRKLGGDADASQVLELEVDHDLAELCVDGAAHVSDRGGERGHDHGIAVELGEAGELLVPVVELAHERVP